VRVADDPDVSDKRVHERLGLWILSLCQLLDLAIVLLDLQCRLCDLLEYRSKRLAQLPSSPRPSLLQSRPLASPRRLISVFRDAVQNRPRPSLLICTSEIYRLEIRVSTLAPFASTFQSLLTHHAFDLGAHPMPARSHQYRAFTVRHTLTMMQPDQQQGDSSC
jgi:hypothetical protein